MFGVTGVVTDSGHVTSPQKVAAYSRAQVCREAVTHSPANFFVTRVLASGGTLAALVSLNSIIFKKYIIASLAGRKARILATLSDDTIPCNASPIASPPVTYRAKFTATTST
jgi:hypothetical protein